jgi:phosphate transport system ATP-binding protein
VNVELEERTQAGTQGSEERRMVHVATSGRGGTPAERHEAASEVVFDLQALSCFYGDFRAVRDISLQIHRHQITALIGPSGCGKSTLLRSFNRMNDLVDTARVEGRILYHGVDLYEPAIDPVEVRRRIGMVFQKPNPFPKSIYDNVAFGPKVAGFRGGRREMDDLVERSLRRAALWEEVKDKLHTMGTAQSGGHQQRLCIWLLYT